METPEALHQIEQQLASLRAGLSFLKIKLAGIPHSEQSVSDRMSLDRMLVEENRLSAEAEKQRQELIRQSAIITFINREREVKLLCDPARAQFIVIESPAGYGKTYLLRRVQAVLGEQPDQTCLYLSIPPMAKVDSRVVVYGHDGTDMAEGALGSPEIVDQVVAAFTRSGIRQATLLVDSLEHLPEGSQQCEAFWNVFVKGLDTRLDQILQFRAVFAGRRVELAWRGAIAWRSNIKRLLDPFDQAAVVEAIMHYAERAHLRQPFGAKIRRVADQIVEITGGHPRAILDLTHKFAHYGFAVEVDPQAPGYAFNDNKLQEIAEEHLKPAIDEIYRAVDPELAETMKTLSVFRIFNANIVKALQDEGLVPITDKATTLLNRLATETFLVQPPGITPFYKDAIVRLLTASWLRIVDREHYLRLTNFAFELYSGWVSDREHDGRALRKSPGSSLKKFFAIEAVYHYADSQRWSRTRPNIPRDVLSLIQSLSIAFEGGFQERHEVLIGLREGLRQDRELLLLMDRVGGEAAADMLAGITLHDIEPE